MRDALPRLRDLGISALGISPDQPAEQKSFHQKLDLNFPLLCDTDHAIAERYGVWGQKEISGKTIETIIRSAFLIDENGAIAGTWYEVSPADTVPELMKFLRQNG